MSAVPDLQQAARTLGASATYDRAQVEYVLNAYRQIFPCISPPLAEYWGLNRKRKWSILTTDFHTASFDQLACLHEAVVNIDSVESDARRKGEALRQACLQHEVGFSMGLSPWTDHLLLETYTESSDTVTVLLGHDWYPIVVADRTRSDSPLWSTDALRYVERYWPGAPQAVFDGATVGFFFNLYPDFRPPLDPKCGNLQGYGYSYAQCLAGLDAMIDAMGRRFRRIQLISWGANVWEALAHRVAGVPAKTGLTAFISSAPGNVRTIQLGGRELPYLPLFHPGHWGNFGRARHLSHVKAGFQALGVGLPGPSGCSETVVMKAREAAPVSVARPTT